MFIKCSLKHFYSPYRFQGQKLDFEFWSEIQPNPAGILDLGKTTVSALHSVQLLPNKQQLNWDGIYIY